MSFLNLLVLNLKFSQVRVDGVPCVGMPVGEIAERMFGPAGTRVNLSLLRGGFNGRMVIVELYRKSIIQTPTPKKSPLLELPKNADLVLKTFEIQNGGSIQGLTMKDRITGSDIVLFIA